MKDFTALLFLSFIFLEVPMAYNESDEKSRILNEIRILETKIADLGDREYEIAMKHKMLNHRLADLRYELRLIEENELKS